MKRMMWELGTVRCEGNAEGDKKLMRGSGVGGRLPCRCEREISFFLFPMYLLYTKLLCI